MIRPPRLQQQGFTIIELMIATAVLSTILVLATVLMVNIGNLYYKGINQSKVQGDVRSITDELSQHLELSNGLSTADPGSNPLYPNIGAYCIGDTRYTFVTNAQIGHQASIPESAPPSGPTYQHVLWRDQNPTSGSCAIDATNGGAMTNASATGGTELIAPNSRLTAFCIGTIDAAGNCTSDTDSPYTISVSVAYGDSDLLDLSANNVPGKNDGAATCTGNTGDRFCATANLTTTVIQRLTGN